MKISDSDMAVFEELAQRDRSLKWYAIADSCQHKDLPSAVVQRDFQARCLFGSSHGSQAAKHTPHLVELESPLANGYVWNWIATNRKSMPGITIIVAEADFDTVWSHLVECTHVILPGGYAMFLAFWDPAILGTLMGQKDDPTLHLTGPVLVQNQRSALSQNLTYWWYWDRCGGMHSVDLNCSSCSPSTLPIELTQQQVDDLVEASVPDNVLHYLHVNQPFLIADVPSGRRYELVRQSLLKAREIGLCTMKDLVIYACMELIYKERMFQDPVILNLLQQVKHSEIVFCDAVKKMPQVK